MFVKDKFLDFYCSPPSSRCCNLARLGRRGIVRLGQPDRADHSDQARQHEGDRHVQSTQVGVLPWEAVGQHWRNAIPWSCR